MLRLTRVALPTAIVVVAAVRRTSIFAGGIISKERISIISSIFSHATILTIYFDGSEVTFGDSSIWLKGTTIFATEVEE